MEKKTKQKPYTTKKKMQTDMTVWSFKKSEPDRMVYATKSNTHMAEVADIWGCRPALSTKKFPGLPVYTEKP